MTNIRDLPQLSASFTIANNADWRDAIQIPSESGVTPLDLTGIDFMASIRHEVDDIEILLQLSTGNNTLINGGTNGTITFDVPALMLYMLDAQTAVMDMVASDVDGNRINLFALSPATITIVEGVTHDLSDIIIDYLAWLTPSLPTTPPDVNSSALALWNNNGVVCIGNLRSTLPDTKPSINGKLYNNNGMLCVSGDVVLPSSRPSATGMLWNNGGVVSLT